MNSGYDFRESSPPLKSTKRYWLNSQYLFYMIRMNKCNKVENTFYRGTTISDDFRGKLYTLDL